MNLADLANDVIDIKATVRNVQRSRAWKVVRAINNGVQTVPELAVALRRDDTRIKVMIQDAAPLIKNEALKKWTIGAGRIRYFIAPEYLEEVTRRMRGRARVPPYDGTPKPIEATDDELLKLPRLLQINKKIRCRSHGHIIIKLMLLLADSNRRLNSCEIYDRLFEGGLREREFLAIALKTLRAENFIEKHRNRYCVHIDCRNIAALAEQELRS